MVKRKRDVMVSSPLAKPSRLTIRMRKNSAGEWRFAERREVEAAKITNSPPAAENAIDFNGAWNKSPASLSSPLQTPASAPLPGTSTNGTPNHGVSLPPSVTGAVKPKSILKARSEFFSQSEHTKSHNKSLSKTVQIVSDPGSKVITPVETSPPSHPVSPPPSGNERVKLSSSPANMSEARPKLKLSLTNRANVQPELSSTPSSAVARTPSIKLNFKSKQTPTQAIKSELSTTPESSTKKRKRTQKAIEADASSSEEPEPPFKKPPQPIRRPTKLTLKQKPASAQAQTPNSAVVPSLKLKTKGKAPRRPIGVGYDSEIEDPEKDPVILEGFILRMQLGPDAEYMRKAIADGTVGLPRASGGADIQVRFFDAHGRRGVVVVRQQKYAASLVDLPCIVEGMKSWDRKGWIKSIDLCQMLVVLGKVATDEEARQYPLPADVDQKTWQYAHGLTAPMRWVRKRRFNRTKRARVDDIEAVERRVKALLEADENAQSTRYEMFDHDPREDDQPGEESGEYESGTGEEEGSEEPRQNGATPQDYFTGQNGQHGGTIESPKYEVDDEDVADLEAMLDAGSENEDEDDSRLPAPHIDRLNAPRDGSSHAITSASGTPSAAAATPASPEEEEDSGDEASDEDDEEEGDGSADEAEEEGDENRQQALDRIEDMKKKIQEQTEVMKGSENTILKRKIAAKIAGLKGDVEQMRRAAGLESEEDE